VRGRGGGVGFVTGGRLCALADVERRSPVSPAATRRSRSGPCPGRGTHTRRFALVLPGFIPALVSPARPHKAHTHTHIHTHHSQHTHAFTTHTHARTDMHAYPSVNHPWLTHHAAPAVLARRCPRRRLCVLRGRRGR
jgi:hypothetical protein